ncbi:LuxR C-terminal-related transcriptional regulator [Amnibacterium sp. CER49]|uniref:ATP-binding protein n=1 Tax=Amnibacterium sp. CER49 TaxID=3039161 RepID=UPI002448C8BE|nr:LuxR C-terminal-related transcriptional regulator [Amnibacterium sp. CER49]MDH2445241.1 LuxR C-terminal-related transcriptional regulator [Amnibacterium sp. CER49]
MTTGGVQEAISPREQEVLAALVGHATNAEIAERLFISVRTVESHIASLLRKTGARDRRALAVLGPIEQAPAARPRVASTLTSFVGRAVEREALATALAEHRLVTALGPGGVGKTRLAFSVAADLADRYPDGAWIVDLVPLTDPDRLAPSVAERLGVQERQGRPAVDALEAWLTTRTALLVLDNCEHLLDPVAELLERLLAACAGLTVLATSRTRLAVPFEWVLPVPGLSTGEQGDAAALFEARARAAGAAVTDTDRERVSRVCEALEGVALAIELAAARLPSLGLDGLEAALGDRLAVLTGGARTDARHRSLRATLDWSHDLLGPGERAVLRRVTVFASPFTAASAVAVSAALPGVRGAAVPAVLAALVDGSLLDAVHAPGATRYRALETIRQYGAERLEAAGERDAVRSAHLAWCRAQAEALEGRTADAETWMRDVDALVDEVRAALVGSLADADRGVACDLAARFARLAFARGMPGEAQRRFEQAASLADDALIRATAYAAAAGAAEARQFGDSALRLRRLAAPAFVEAGRLEEAVIQLARSGETIRRFQGILTTVPEDQAAVALLDEAASIGAGSDRATARVAAARLMAEADEDPAKIRQALALATEFERLDDRVGWSASLDTACAARLVQGDLRGAFDAAAAREDVLAPLGVVPETGIELTDALQMATECAVGIGDLVGAERLARRLLDLPYHALEPHLATPRAMLVNWVQGDLSGCLRLGERFLDGWERAGRPIVHNLAPSAAAAANAARLAADAGGEQRWLEVLRALADTTWTSDNFEVLGFRVLALLHEGRAKEAHAGTLDSPARWDKWYGAIWRPWYAALRAEAAVLAGAPETAERISLARPAVAPNVVASTLLERAEALVAERDRLPAIADRLESQGARYQAARTRIMAGGELRTRGEREMAACGAAPMAWAG